MESRSAWDRFTAAERKFLRTLRTPRRVQQFLNELPYNRELPPLGETLRSFRGVLRHQTVHCLEAAIFAAAALEPYGFPPLVLSFESVDKLEHVLYVYQHKKRWGSIGRSRDPGLHGRKPVFRTARALALSYFDPYVDRTGCITAYAVVNLHEQLGNYDWRLSNKNVWKVEQILIDYSHQKLPVNRERVKRLRKRYRAFIRAHPDHRPLRYSLRSTWSELPREFSRSGYDVGWVK